MADSGMLNGHNGLEAGVEVGVTDSDTVNANGTVHSDTSDRETAKHINGGRHVNGERNGGGSDNHSVISPGDTNVSGTPPIPNDNERDAPSATTRRKQLQIELVLKIIENAKNTGSPVVQLQNQGIRKLPEELLELSHLQYLYLEGNDLTGLPDDFFDKFPKLRWLDLRRNYLASIPSGYLGSHKNLKTLLLEGNELKTLPLELGFIPTLNGLNICNNPLEFPPAEVVERGTQSVLSFLRDLLKAKNQGRLGSDLHKDDAPRFEDLTLDSDSAVSSEDEWGRCPPQRHTSQQQYQLQRQHSKDSRGDSCASDSELTGPVPTSAALHKPATYNEIKKKRIEKVRKAGALGTIEKKAKKPSMKERRMRKVDRFPEPPHMDRVKQRFLEEQRLFHEKEINEKTDVILQKRKDQEELKRFRDDGKRMQMGRYREAMIYGGAKEPVEVATKAPFGVEKEHLKIPTNEERIAQAVKESHEKMRRRRALSPRTQAKVEAERIARDKELERRIKGHMLSMQDRRRAPKGTPQEEMEAARKELEIANQLQAEIEARRKNLEYRFTAFTGS